jgi:hypothetical protein
VELSKRNSVFLEMVKAVESSNFANEYQETLSIKEVIERATLLTIQTLDRMDQDNWKLPSNISALNKGLVK